MDERTVSHCDTGQALRWQDLRKEEQCVLFSAAEQSMLIGVLASWEPELDWPGRAAWTPRLAVAAENLLGSGFIEVYEQYLSGADPRLLSAAEARTALRNRDNWWRGEVRASARGEEEDTDSTFYALAVTKAGAAVLGTRGTDDLYRFLRHLAGLYSMMSLWCEVAGTEDATETFKFAAIRQLAQS